MTPRYYSRQGSIRSGISGLPAAPTVDTAPGALDEKNEIYMKAVAMEEGDEDDQDIESGLPPRPITNVASIKVGLAMILVIVTQMAGIANVRCSWRIISQKQADKVHSLLVNICGMAGICAS